MNNHICVFFCYEQVDVIRTAFDSNYIESIDFFVIENGSKNSKEIAEYFQTKKLKGYIQFEKNIAGNAMNIFLKDYQNLLKEYEYITFTDGDFFVYDAKDMFEEIIDNLETSTNSMVSSGDLYLGNDYRVPDERKIGIEYYLNDMKNNTIQKGYKIERTSVCFATIKKQDLYLTTLGYFSDVNLLSWITERGGTWCSLLRNLSYHLTWDLYVEGNEYFEWKKSVYPEIWTITENANYKIII